jgi:hypothetical protein
MIPVRIYGADVKLTSDAEDVHALWALRVDSFLVSAWEPTPKELESLNNGGKVLLFVKGPHPAVMITAE